MIGLLTTTGVPYISGMVPIRLDNSNIQILEAARSRGRKRQLKAIQQDSDHRGVKVWHTAARSAVNQRVLESNRLAATRSLPFFVAR
jgi:hypothetical protein